MKEFVMNRQDAIKEIFRLMGRQEPELPNEALAFWRGTNAGIIRYLKEKFKITEEDLRSW